MATVPQASGGGGRKLNMPGNKIAAGLIWGLGCFMTIAALSQAAPPEMSGGAIMALAIGLQVVLTLGQSPVWAGRGGLISYVLLGTDAIINFGGTMAVLANIDDVGSVQAMTATFVGYGGEWPMFVKGLLALFVSAVIAGLPEYLWSLKD
jgi:hypothetical protein